MSDNLVTQLQDGLAGKRPLPFRRIDTGPTVRPTYAVDGYELQALSTALTEARAEIERLRASQERMFCTACGTVTRNDRCDCNKYGPTHEMYREPHFINYADQCRADASAAEPELSTLRARVREVVGPFARINAFEVAFSEHGKTYRLDYNATFADQLAFRHFRAARQLMEDLK